MNILKEHERGTIPNNKEIFESFLVADNKIKSYKSIVCSISGGSDSDLVMDLLCRINKSKVKFVFF